MKNQFMFTSKLALCLCLCLCSLNLFAEDDKDTTVIIPSTGHLPIKPSRNFTGPAGVIVSNCYGSGNATSAGLRFNNQELGESVIIAQQANSSSGLILTASPGTYTLTLTDKTATKQFFSTSITWVEEPGTVKGKEDYRIYKFVNQEGHIGFERDERHAADNYQNCDMEEGEHLYLSVGEKMFERLTATLNTTVDELKFIPWSEELWGCPAVSSTGITAPITASGADSQYYDLQGHKLSQPKKGLNIQNGKKFVK